jgi:hypothetical protein
VAYRQQTPRPKVFRAAVGPCLAGAATALPRPLHTHLRLLAQPLLAQPGGALVWDHHPTRHPSGQLLQRQKADRQDRAVRGGLQQDQSTVQLDSHGRLNPGEAPATLLANLRGGALVVA